MNAVFLTQDDGIIIGWVAKLLGLIMNGIFTVIDAIGLPNIGLAIILFTIVVNLLMLPLTIKQQKFSKLSAKMNPELQAIQKKYKGKKDNESAMMQNQEMQALYAKYGVSPSGSCVQLLIQMPILFALYRVIYSMPAYVTKIKETFTVLAEKIISVDNGQFLQNSDVETIQNTITMYGQNMTEGNMTNGVIDVLNKLSTTDMAIVSEHYGLADLTYEGELILSSATETGLLDTYNNFLGLNMGNSPQHIIVTAFQAGAWALVIGAVMIPLIAALTQWINHKLMPSTDTNSDNPMASSMKTMNTIMPIMSIMSAWFCFSLPCGMGLYWIAGSVVRSIQQIFANKYFDSLDYDEMIKTNQAKKSKKMEKIEKRQELINAYANINAKSINSKANSVNPVNTADTTDTSEKKETQKVDYNSNYKPGSMMAKANMVKEFNSKNNKDA